MTKGRWGSVGGWEWGCVLSRTWVLYGMLGANHAPQSNALTILVFVALGAWPVWHAYGVSKKVGLSV